MTHSLTVTMTAGKSLIVVTTEMLASYAVSGTADSLADCRHGGWGITYCSHSRDTSIICGEFMARASVMSVFQVNAKPM